MMRTDYAHDFFSQSDKLKLLLCSLTGCGQDFIIGMSHNVTYNKLTQSFLLHTLKILVKL